MSNTHRQRETKIFANQIHFGVMGYEGISFFIETEKKSSQIRCININNFCRKLFHFTFKAIEWKSVLIESRYQTQPKNFSESWIKRWWFLSIFWMKLLMFVLFVLLYMYNFFCRLLLCDPFALKLVWFVKLKFSIYFGKKFSSWWNDSVLCTMSKERIMCAQTECPLTLSSLEWFSDSFLFFFVVSFLFHYYELWIKLQG